MMPEDQRILRRITLRRSEILTLLADGRTEREAATMPEIELTGIRSHVSQLKALTGCSSVRELGRWWRNMRGEWLFVMMVSAGIENEVTEEGL